MRPIKGETYALVQENQWEGLVVKEVTIGTIHEGYSIIRVGRNEFNYSRLDEEDYDKLVDLDKLKFHVYEAFK
jgi:hypothetical protein